MRIRISGILTPLCLSALFALNVMAQGGWRQWDIYLRDGSKIEANPLGLTDDGRLSHSLKSDASPGEGLERATIDYIAARGRNLPPPPEGDLQQDLVVMLDGRRTYGPISFKSIKFSEGTIVQNGAEIVLRDVAYIKFASPKGDSRKPARRNRQIVYAADERPVDFSVKYEWRAGSMPPPYHFEYTININPAGQGKVLMIPDYPSDRVPRWTETFALTRVELDKLYRVMVDNDLFTKRWQRLDRQPIGGSRQEMMVTAQGKQFVLEDYLVADQEAPAKAMSSAVISTVPKMIWDKLNAQREKYMQEHSRK